MTRAWALGGPLHCWCCVIHCWLVNCLMHCFGQFSTASLFVQKYSKNRSITLHYHFWCDCWSKAISKAICTEVAWVAPGALVEAEGHVMICHGHRANMSKHHQGFESDWVDDQVYLYLPGIRMSKDSRVRCDGMRGIPWAVTHLQHQYSESWRSAEHLRLAAHSQIWKATALPPNMTPRIPSFAEDWKLDVSVAKCHKVTQIQSSQLINSFHMQSIQVERLITVKSSKQLIYKQQKQQTSTNINTSAGPSVAGQHTSVAPILPSLKAACNQDGACEVKIAGHILFRHGFLRCPKKTENLLPLKYSIYHATCMSASPCVASGSSALPNPMARSGENKPEPNSEKLTPWIHNCFKLNKSSLQICRFKHVIFGWNEGNKNRLKQIKSSSIQHSCFETMAHDPLSIDKGGRKIHNTCRHILRGNSPPKCLLTYSPRAISIKKQTHFNI